MYIIYKLYIYNINNLTMIQPLVQPLNRELITFLVQ